MPRLGLKFLDGPARQDRPVKHTLEELSEQWYVVFRTPPDPKQAAVYERVSANGNGQVGHYRHTDTLDEVRRNHS